MKNLYLKSLIDTKVRTSENVKKEVKEWEVFETSPKLAKVYLGYKKHFEEVEAKDFKGLDTKETNNSEDLAKLSKRDLQDLALEKGCIYTDKATKANLIDLINEADNLDDEDNLDEDKKLD